jgi:hypothetical protein
MSTQDESKEEPMPSFNTSSLSTDSPSMESQNENIPMEMSPPEVEEGSPEVSPEVEEGSPEVSPMEEGSPEVSPMEEGTPEVSPMEEGSPEVSPMEEGTPEVEEGSPEEVVPTEVEEPLEEPVVSESKQMDKDKQVVDEAAVFRRKLTNTKKRLPTMDDHQKDEIRNGVIREFMNILKISKRATTRKKLGRRINNLRAVFNETLDVLNGTAKKHPKKRKTKKQKVDVELPPTEIL